MAMGGVARVGQVQLLQTFVTLAVSAVLLGETVDAVTVAAAAAIPLPFRNDRRPSRIVVSIGSTMLNRSFCS